MTQQITSSQVTTDRPEKDKTNLPQSNAARPHILLRREARRVRRIR